VVDVTETDIALCLNRVGLVNIIFNNTDTFIDTVFKTIVVVVVDVTETDTTICLNSVSLVNVILNDTDTLVYSVGLVEVIL
jgi:hypothetical protein